MFAPLPLSAARSPQRTVDKTMSCISERLHVHIPASAVPAPTADWEEKRVFSCHLPEPPLLKELPEMPCVCSVGGVPVYQIWTSSWDLDMIQKDLPWSCCLLCCPLLPFPSMRYVAPYIKYSNTHTLLYSRWPHHNLPRA